MRVLIRVQMSVYKVLIDVEACKAVKKMKKIAEGRGRVCTPTLSIFQ